MATAVQNPLLDALNRYSILEPAQQEELPRLQQLIPQPRALAKELISREWLTAYQINQIFLGHAEDLVLGPYLCLNKIGEGGMGYVYKARQRPSDRIVALKVLRRECVDQGKSLQRFQREIRAVGQLQHPNIVKAFDAGEVNGLHFIAMEYIEGVDLARMVKRQGPLAVRPALDFIRQAALGLQHAHDSNLVHRDIKPANLLVSRETGATRSRPGVKGRWGTVKILDLGLARINHPSETSLTIQGTVMGTPDFISPEQALDPHSCDSRADLYSLGCTLYYLLAGRIPFPRGGVTEKLLNHQMNEPEPVALVRRSRLQQESAKTGKRIDESFYLVPPDVDALIRKLMAKRPADRYQSPAELAGAIEQLLEPTASDPLTNTATITHTNITLPCLTSVVGIETMPMPAEGLLATQTPWQTLEASKDVEPIVNLRPPSKGSSATRWWFVGAVTAIVIAAVMFIQGHRQFTAHGMEPRLEKRK